MKLVVDGESLDINVNKLPEPSISALLNLLNLKLGQVAIKFNNKFLMRDQLHNKMFNENDSVEIIKILAGG